MQYEEFVVGDGGRRLLGTVPRSNIEFPLDHISSPDPLNYLPLCKYLAPFMRIYFTFHCVGLTIQEVLSSTVKFEY